MEEGYVVVRMSPEHAYCGKDLFLRSQTHKLKSVCQALVDLFGESRYHPTDGSWGKRLI
jgi:hypothetical protein